MSVSTSPRRAVATAVALLVAAIALLPAAPAFACSCAMVTPEAALADAPAGFVGELNAIETGGTDEFGQETKRWVFTVEAVLAGELGPEVAVLAPEDTGANCGLAVAPGERVGLLLHGTGAGWSSSSCHTYEPDALLAAGDPVPPAPAATPVAAEDPPDDGSSRWAVVLGTVLAGLAVLGATAAFVRRRR